MVFTPEAERTGQQWQMWPLSERFGRSWLRGT